MSTSDRNECFLLDPERGVRYAAHYGQLGRVETESPGFEQTTNWNQLEEIDVGNFSYTIPQSQ